MSTKAVVILGLLVGAVAGFAVVYVAVSPSAQPGEYMARNHGVAITPPADWEVAEGLMGTVAAFLEAPQGPTDPFRENLNITIEMLPAGMDLTKYLEVAIEQRAKLITDLKMLDSRDITVGGLPGRLFEFTSRQGQFELHQLQGVFIANDRAYVVTGTAVKGSFDEYADTFQRAIDTLRIL